jgi:hypothetical protein
MLNLPRPLLQTKKRPPFSVCVFDFDATGRRPLANLNLIYHGTVICAVSLGAACPASLAAMMKIFNSLPLGWPVKVASHAAGI